MRYSGVPWLADSDLTPMGEPEVTVELRGAADITRGLRVVQPFGVGTDAMLSVHASKDDGSITLAITDSLALDVVPVTEPQSNPRRTTGDDDGI